MSLPTPPELKKMSEQNLQGELERARSKTYLLRVQMRTQQKKDVHEYHNQKKLVAQILTELRGRKK